MNPLDGPRSWLAVLAAVTVAGCRPGPRDVAAMLHLDAPPPSLRVVACEDWSFTDELVKCSVEVAPAEFPALLRGYAWAEDTVRGRADTVGGGPRVGPAFPVTRAYSVRPPEFTDGGQVTIFVNDTRNRAVVDFYRE